MDNWTKIIPEALEALGFVDLTTADAENLGIYEYMGFKPCGVEYIRMSYLASHWEMTFVSDKDGEEFRDIVTAEDFNEVMEHLGMPHRLLDKDTLEEGMYLCAVRLKHTDRMLLKYSDGQWWQYLAPNVIPNTEGWIGVDYPFYPIRKVLYAQ